MTDIALLWNNAISRADVAMAGPDLAVDPGLQTAVTVSLLSDAPALPGDSIPDGGGPRGWWADAYNGFVTGSRLWLLKRSTLTQATLNAAQDYATEALQWMVNDGVAGDVSVVATAVTINAMNLAVTITQNGAKRLFNVVWQGQAAGIISVAGQ